MPRVRVVEVLVDLVETIDDARRHHRAAQRVGKADVLLEPRLRQHDVVLVGHRDDGSVLEVVVLVQLHMGGRIHAEAVQVAVVRLDVDDALGDEALLVALVDVAFEHRRGDDVELGDADELHQQRADRVSVLGQPVRADEDRLGHGVGRVDLERVRGRVPAAEQDVLGAQDVAVGGLRHVRPCHRDRLLARFLRRQRLSAVVDRGMGGRVGGGLKLGPGRHQLRHVEGERAEHAAHDEAEDAEDRHSAVFAAGEWGGDPSGHDQTSFTC